MRCTRNRQLNKAYKTNEFTGDQNFPIKEYINHSSGVFLDPSFKWHRNFEGWGENWIEFGGDETSYGTIIQPKYDYLKRLGR